MLIIIIIIILDLVALCLLLQWKHLRKMSPNGSAYNK